jgi:hypothetical protein
MPVHRVSASPRMTAREMLGRYSGAISGGGHREEMGYGLPGAAGELEGAQ